MWFLTPGNPVCSVRYIYGWFWSCVNRFCVSLLTSLIVNNFNNPENHCAAVATALHWLVWISFSPLKSLGMTYDLPSPLCVTIPWAPQVPIVQKLTDLFKKNDSEGWPPWAGIQTRLQPPLTSAGRDQAAQVSRNNLWTASWPAVATHTFNPIPTK